MRSRLRDRLTRSFAARRSAVATTVALVAVLAACGGSSASPATKIVSAAEATRAQHTLQVAVTVTGTSPGTPMLTAHGSGAFDLTTNEGQLALTVAGVAQLAGLGRIQTVLSGPIVYANLGRLVPGGRPWVKIDVRALPQLPGFDLTPLKQLQSAEPFTVLDGLEGAGQPLTVLGPDTVNGVATTHYRTQVDLERAATRFSGTEAAALRTIAGNLTSPTFPADVWIDARGLVRQASYTATAKAINPGAAPVQFSAMFDFTGFGQPVSVQVPAAGQTVDLAALFSQLGS